jgi:hypothetical protein
VRACIEWIGRRGTVLMPLGILIGVAVQPLAHMLFPLLPLTVYVMLTIVLSRLDVERAIAHIRKPKVFLISLVYGFLLLPLAMSLITTARPDRRAGHLRHIAAQLRCSRACLRNGARWRPDRCHHLRCHRAPSADYANLH